MPFHFCTYTSVHDTMIVACAFSEMNETIRNKIFDRFRCLYRFILAMKVVSFQRQQRNARIEMQFKLFKHCILCCQQNDQKPKSFRFHLTFLFFLCLHFTSDCSRCSKIISALSTQYIQTNTHSHAHIHTSLLWSFG